MSDEIQHGEGKPRTRFWAQLLLVYISVAALAGAAMELSGILRRPELQTINLRFEARPWLSWQRASLARLNVAELLRYHREHEIPRQWWAWDYTLSWLIEHNHPPVKHKIVIFNHMLEDEPPRQAVAVHPWMEPLLAHPLPRRTVAEIVTFLARSGARLIVLDNDFPQYSPDDRELARAIYGCASGSISGRPVPVLMARTVNRLSSGNLVQLEVPSEPAGVLDELRKLSPSTDALEQFTGITAVIPDEDQVVRRMALRLPSLTGEAHQSIVLKAMKALGQRLPSHYPDLMDIDFSVPPLSQQYPVRPLSYLLDPDMRRTIAGPKTPGGDVSVTDAIVILGDGVTDVYNTPITNLGINQMSGSEILAHAIETISRRSWPVRLTRLEGLGYTALVIIAGAFIWVGWKMLQNRTARLATGTRPPALNRAAGDFACFLVTVCLSQLAAFILFSTNGAIVPLIVPSLALGFGTLGAVLLEREHERTRAFEERLRASEEKLILANEKYEADLRRQEAEARTREVITDRQRRREFARRIKHDLNAPVSVLNWTLSDLHEGGLSADDAREKVARLLKGSDKLCDLIDKLVQSYESETEPEQDMVSRTVAATNLRQIIEDSVDLQRPLARRRGITVESSIPDSDLWIEANSLELSRVFDNLLGNAIKHNPTGTSVRVTVEQNGGGLVVSIADNGKGIPKDDLNRIFQPGFKAGDTPGDSQGLGLDIVKTLIEKMGGSVSVSSESGQGTSFILTVPAASPPGVENPSGSDGANQREENP